MESIERNWARNLAYSGQVVRPRSVDEARELIARSRRVRMLGSRHSFNRIADGEILLETSGLPAVFELDEDARTVTVSGGSAYGHVAPRLHAAGWALPNLASLPHISIGGAVSTGTHGSGTRNRSLAAAVSAVEFIGPDGESVTVRRGEPDFAGSVVSLGALGLMNRVSLDIVPAFDVEQTVFRDLAFDAVVDDPGALLGLGYSVSIFTTWQQHDTVDQLWVKRRPDLDAPLERTVAGGHVLDEERHPIPDASPEQTTPQRGSGGPWHERLPHFLMSETPSVGDELQSEYFVAAADASEALRRLREIREQLAPALFVTEVRAIAADDLWLSGALERDTVGIHFTWRPVDEVARLLPLVEERLLPLGARPHWGKVFSADLDALTAAYPRLGDFRALAARRDPEGVFVNDFLRDRVGFDA